MERTEKARKMTCELPCMSYMALYIISMHIVNSNSRSSSSNHWKLNLSAGKVEATKEQVDTEEEKVLSILTASRVVKNGEWTVEGTDKVCSTKTSCKNDTTDLESGSVEWYVNVATGRF